MVLLQGGDDKKIQGWKMICQLSRLEFQELYDRLDVEIEEVGESFYNPMLKGMVERLEEQKIAVEDQGAKCIFIPK